MGYYFCAVWCTIPVWYVVDEINDIQQKFVGIWELQLFLVVLHSIQGWAATIRQNSVEVEPMQPIETIISQPKVIAPFDKEPSVEEKQQFFDISTC